MKNRRCKSLGRLQQYENENRTKYSSNEETYKPRYRDCGCAWKYQLAIERNCFKKGKYVI